MNWIPKYIIQSEKQLIYTTNIIQTHTQHKTNTYKIQQEHTIISTPINNTIYTLIDINNNDVSYLIRLNKSCIIWRAAVS